MSSTETFQISLEAARMYESRFVPAIFAEWAPLLVDLAGVTRGQAVLDVACGTGVVARAAADRIDGDGVVVGLDLNEAMLTVAREVRPDLEWQRGDAAALPFPDRSFDVVLCQMALMFLPDRQRGLREMARVAVEGGTVGLVVPASLADQPAYRPFVELAAEVLGPQARSLLGAYWACGELGELHELAGSAGLRVLESRTHVGTAHFASADDLVDTEVQGSPLAARISDDDYRRLRIRAREALTPFATVAGLRVPLHGHLVIAAPVLG